MRSLKIAERLKDATAPRAVTAAELRPARLVVVAIAENRSKVMMPALRHRQSRSVPMWPIFNGVMRVTSSLIGIAMIFMGTVWMLQGLNLAFRVGFMVGNYHWTIYGALLVLVGVAQLIWSNARMRRP